MNRVYSIFSQLLQLFSRTEFALAVGQHKAERRPSPQVAMHQRLPR